MGLKVQINLQTWRAHRTGLPLQMRRRPRRSKIVICRYAGAIGVPASLNPNNNTVLLLPTCQACLID